MEKGRLTQRRSIISNARVIKAITECGPLLLASVGNSPKLERMDFSPVLSAMIMAFLYNQTTAPFFKIITQNLLLFYIAFCCGFSTAFGCLPRLAPRHGECRKQYNAFQTGWAALHCTFKQCREVLHLVISRIIFISGWNCQFWRKYPREINLFNSFLICQQYHKCQMRWGLLVSKSGISITFVNFVTIKTTFRPESYLFAFAQLNKLLGRGFAPGVSQSKSV